MKLPFLKKKNAASHAFRYGKQLQPSRDWLVLLVVWFVLLVLSVGYHIWLFARVTNGEVLETDTAVTIQEELNLDAANEVFEAREAERAQYLNTYQFVDPSR